MEAKKIYIANSVTRKITDRVGAITADGKAVLEPRPSGRYRRADLSIHEFASYDIRDVANWLLDAVSLRIGWKNDDIRDMTEDIREMQRELGEAVKELAELQVLENELRTARFLLGS